MTCGKGYKHRQTWCQFGEDRLDDRFCGSSKPESVQTCQQQECAAWQVGPWGQVSHPCIYDLCSIQYTVLDCFLFKAVRSRVIYQLRASAYDDVDVDIAYFSNWRGFFLSLSTLLHLFLNLCCPSCLSLFTYSC